MLHTYCICIPVQDIESLLLNRKISSLCPCTFLRVFYEFLQRLCLDSTLIHLPMLLSSNRKHCIFIEMDYHSPPTLYRKILSLNFPPVALQSCEAVCFSTPDYKYVFSGWAPSNITNRIQPNSSQHDSNEGPLPIVVIYTPL